MLSISNKIISLIEVGKRNVAKTANAQMLVTYFKIGSLLITEFQKGEERAEYGMGILKQISDDLSSKFQRGFSVKNLERMRMFYLTYQKSSSELRNSDIFQKSSNALTISLNDNKKIALLPISWSHYLFLLSIDNEAERQFYEIEAYKNQWSLKEMERQFNSGLFLRLSSGKGKNEIIKLAKEGNEVEKAEDVIKDPFVLEFLGLKQDYSYTESELETEIINQIESFMLELGKGFFFGGRQVRFSLNEDNYFVDLVFYNRFLKCFVLIDLKIGKLKHQDIGQMQMYINYYDRYVKKDDENPTIGIVLCRTKNDAMVEITLPKENNQLYASEYETILPNKEELKQLIENNYEK